MKADEKKKEIARILPLAWNSYQHMYDVRENNISNKINFLLVIISFLSVMSIEFFTYFEENLFFLPLFFQLMAFLMLLKTFFIKGKMVHWFKLDETLEDIKNKEINEKTLATLKALENDTWINLIVIKTIIDWSLYFILISLWNLSMVLIYSIGYAEISYFAFISIIFLIFFYVYKKNQPEFKVKENSENYLKEILKWEES